MAGQPLRRALEAKIESSGGYDAILERIADGETLRSIAESFESTRGLLTTLLHHDPERSAAVRKAQQISAGNLAEDVITIAALATPSTERVARLQCDVKRWIASKRDPEQFGEKQAPLLQINAGSFHLSALQAVETARLNRLGAQTPLPSLLPARDATESAPSVSPDDVTIDVTSDNATV